jgi:hypothetical protein
MTSQRRAFLKINIDSLCAALKAHNDINMTAKSIDLPNRFFNILSSVLIFKKALL